MKNTTPPAPITDKDRLGLTLFLAVAVHGILILGLSFKALSEQVQRQPPALNVLLVQTAADKAPKEANYIAQANQRASGSSDRAGHPGRPFFALNPNRTDGVAPVPQMAMTPPATAEHKHRDVLTSDNADYSLPPEARTRGPRSQATPDNQRLLQLQLEQARLTAEIRRETEDYNQRPRRLFLDTVNAKTAVEAGYLAHWVRRVERVGNLNYPDAAIRDRLHGRLILNVLISHTGHVLKIVVAQSSGSAVLDDAAKRIVRLASPFPPFPAAMRKQYDQLMITRTWIFRSGELRTTANR
ncbi:energy transducer TonB [Acidihalobacter prosperus]|uniref:TonB C-terminal domain-containing protein n=1 Tax=Acidihalobacter prosperus TaxID=160660 RepID=A0A1A6C0Q1_9GAMM|nr:energy transducer TonB [Acidihalobacter prosperus]OBS08135.1 hypothetical protein Thpro_022385 [Acidihalobacter prosperus]